MNRTRKLATVAVLAGATTAPACGYIGTAAAQQIPNCGGQAAMHQVPAGGRAFCVNDRQLLDGIVWSNTVIVSADGSIQVNYNVPLPPATDVPLEVEVHFGGSGDGGNLFLGVMPAGDSSTTVWGKVDLTQYAAYGCQTQIDAKAYNGDRDTATNRVRVSGGWFQWPNCETTAPTTTVPTSAPATSPTSPPASSGSTTGAPTPPSVAGATLPATGSGGDAVGYGIIALFLGLGALIVGYARKNPAS